MTVLYTVVNPLNGNELVYPNSVSYTVPDGCCDQWYGLSTGYGALIEEAGEQAFTIANSVGIVFAQVLDSDLLVTEDGWPLVRIFDEGDVVTASMAAGLGYEVGFALYMLRFGATLASGFTPPAPAQLRATGL
jgi:hypothetical protein